MERRCASRGGGSRGLMRNVMAAASWRNQECGMVR